MSNVAMRRYTNFNANPPAAQQIPPGRVETFKQAFKHRTTDTFKARLEKLKPQPQLYEGCCSTYNGLSWATLKNFLEERFPGYTFSERKRNDQWLFDTPEPLTQEDKERIEQLRVAGKEQLRRQEVELGEGDDEN